ncbi:Rv3235 family protein [Goodfellowiella coeruleoviolacea]|uniref:Uncharacterized protein n=1 Tax=Goodfellowiella coeruleoviolacea TaxID=334858 RepID=A0AAE3GIA3_9PSEU|nr:Rv3235 family protein [Goodfellowiella coeruleoviolacea]MCP2167970.1 hypothetical protein [Goodfellowiella coeruleoviolacea]
MTTALAIQLAPTPAHHPHGFAVRTLPGYEPDLPPVLRLVGREPPAPPRPPALPAAAPAQLSGGAGATAAGLPVAPPSARHRVRPAVPATARLSASTPPSDSCAPAPAPVLRLARAGQSGHHRAGHSQAGDEQRLSQAMAIALVMLRAVFEVLAGHRPIAQLAALTSPGLHRRLLVAPSWPVPGVAEPVRVAVNRIDLPCRGVMEVAATLHGPARVRAVAARAESIEGRWCYTLLHVL